MMAGFGGTSRGNPRSRGRTRSRTGPDGATLGIVGLVCAIAGFFVLGIVLGPVAVFCGWLAMGRRWNSGSVPAVVAVVLGAIDTVLAIVWPAGAAGPGTGLL
ncbi:small hydrophobic protein [Streptomyces sp. GC420]|uniref:small hydrophobic protein n=1 Tax=Streptomyces sp. GC420 TaxID=2697568 RepID=UPI001414E523|nr:small hydrophobic protein [Streptomyces sp. GC420]NBM17159.1 small hydrophobic protein [Streptomyces sp. GC420]